MERDVVEMDATGVQKVRITQLCMALHIKDALEEIPMTKGEAGRLVRELATQLAARRRQSGQVKHLGTRRHHDR